MGFQQSSQDHRGARNLVLQRDGGQGGRLGKGSPGLWEQPADFRKTLPGLLSGLGEEREGAPWPTSGELSLRGALAWTGRPLPGLSASSLGSGLGVHLLGDPLPQVSRGTG